MKSKMKFTGLAALLAMAGSASAAIPAVNASFYVSGASAAREIPKAIASELCDPAVNDRADYEYTSKPKDYTITVCTLKGTAEVPASLRGQKIATYTRAAGGTLYGVRPLADPNAFKPIAFIDQSTCPADDGNPATTQQCPGLTSATPNTFGTTGFLPDVGISDEDSLFVCNVSKEVGPVQCTTGEIAGIKNTAKFKGFRTYQIVWTVQAGHKASPAATADSLSDYLGGGDTVGGNISETVLTGVFSGAYTSVNQVLKAMGQPPLATDKGLKICRRTNTSGTQSGHTQLWTGAAYCGGTDAWGFVNAASDDDNAGNGFPLDYEVVENNSSGDVEACMLSDPTRTIGINSLENGEKTGWRNLSINTAPPSLEAAARGEYSWYHESTAQYNLDIINNAGTAPAADPSLASRSTATQRLDYATLFIKNVSSAAKINASGLNGILAIRGSINGVTNTANNPYVATNPVAWTTKNGVNCRDPRPNFPAVGPLP